MRLKQAPITAPQLERPPAAAENEARLAPARLPWFLAAENAHSLPTPVFRLAETGREARAGMSSRLSPRMLSFAAVVLLPIALAASYLFVIAADQYVAEFRFSLNTADAPRLDPLSLLTGNTSRSPAALESQIVVQYLTSRAIVDELGTTLDLRRIFSPPQADWWARLQFVLGEIRAFRDREGLIDPGENAKSSSLLAARLRDELVRANAELSTLKTYMREDAPGIKVLNARIKSLETQRRAVAQDGWRTR